MAQIKTCPSCDCIIKYYPQPEKDSCSCTCHGKISEFDRGTIREGFRRSATIGWFAKHYHTTEDEIADILHLPKNKAAREKLHRDHNFYDHGFGEERSLERKLEFYSEFLEGGSLEDGGEDGDFERFQPCCYMDRNDPEFLRLKKIAETIPESDDPRSEVRRIWILKRFMEYQGPEWEKAEAHMLELLNQLNWKVSPHLRALADGGLHHEK